jgi:thioredoxin-like negative regulator of GroEL
MSRRRRISSETRLRPKRGWLLLAGGGFLVLLVLLLARPVQRHFQQAEAESLVALARSALEQQAWEEALRHAGAALQAQPGHGAALHVAADAFNRLGGHPDEVVDLLSKAKEAGQTQPEVDLKLAQAHLRRGDLAAAQTVLSRVPPEARGWMSSRSA